MEHRQDIHPGSTIGTNMQAIRLIGAVQKIATIGANWLELMCKRHIARTRSGTLCLFAAVATKGRTSSMLTKNLSLFQAIFKQVGGECIPERKTMVFRGIFTSILIKSHTCNIFISQAVHISNPCTPEPLLKC